MKSILAALLLTLYLAVPAHAQAPNRAGIVVDYGGGRVESACVTFPEPEITGLELLQRSGLPVSFQVTSGVTVCSIGNVGCSYPAEGCFCQCAGIGTCTYWSYHLLDEGGSWQYSQIGAGAVRVLPGQMNGWRWGAGQASDAPSPLPTSFEAVCAAPEPTALPPTALPAAPTNTPAPQPTVPPPTASAVPSVAQALPTMTAQPAPTPSVTPPPAVPLGYAAFAGLALALGAGVLWARRG